MESNRKMKMDWQTGLLKEGKVQRPVKQKHSRKSCRSVAALGFTILALCVIMAFDELNVHVRNTVRILRPPTPAPGEDVHQQVVETSHGCTGRYIYMYELPPHFNQLLVQNCHNISAWTDMCENLSNNGLGEQLRLPEKDVMSSVLVPQEAWFKTDQFNLEVIFHERMKLYPCLTTDPAKASMSYIPFYPALDLTKNLYSPWMNVRDRLSQRLVGWLQNHPHWQALQGRRHFFVLGRIAWDFLREEEAVGWGNVLLSLPELKNTTKLVIERSIWRSDMMAVPYPSSFHPSSDADIHEWESVLRSSSRDFFVSFAGSSRNRNMSGTVRGELLRQCEKSSRCTLVLCTHEKCVRNPQIITELSLRSVFCLQPPGDSATRKGIFDCLIAGCIPVFFDSQSAQLQYIWHLPDNGSSYSVTLPGKDVVNNQFDVMEHLAQVSKEVISRMQATIVGMLPQLIYGKAVPNADRTSNDAFDVCIDGLRQRFRLEETA